MDIIKNILFFITRVITDVVYVFSIYYIGMSIFGILRFKDKKKIPPKKSFALVVAAHNEERVISDIVRSLNKIDYPKELYDIFVIADNCTDKTALRAREDGALVYERFNKEKRGKGYALEWMFDEIFKMEKKYDSVVVFDADNLVSKNFLMEMNKKLCEGFKVVQCYVDSKNPKDTWITGSYSISFWTTNRMYQLARSNIGLSCQLCGTGLCIDTEVLQKLGWGATCLTEDLEFTCKLVLNGYKVGWSHDAVIYDEKPLSLQQSWRQRKRWMQGFSDVASRYFFKLIKKGVTEFKFTAIDCAIYCIQPITVILICLSMIASMVQYVLKAYHFISHINSGVIYSVNSNMIVIGVVLLGLMEFIYTPFILILEKKLNLKIFWYYIIFPLYSITWLPITILGIIDKNNKEWNHTQHTRSMSIDELEKAN